VRESRPNPALIYPSWMGCTDLAAKTIWQIAALQQHERLSTAPVNRMQRHELGWRGRARRLLHCLLCCWCSSAGGLHWIPVYRRF